MKGVGNLCLFILFTFIDQYEHPINRTGSTFDISSVRFSSPKIFGKGYQPVGEVCEKWRPKWNVPTPVQERNCLWTFISSKTQICMNNNTKVRIGAYIYIQHSCTIQHQYHSVIYAQEQLLINAEEQLYSRTVIACVDFCITFGWHHLLVLHSLLQLVPFLAHANDQYGQRQKENNARLKGQERGAGIRWDADTDSPVGQSHPAADDVPTCTRNRWRQRGWGHRGRDRHEWYMAKAPLVQCLHIQSLPV